jgi:hypothetical protein
MELIFSVKKFYFSTDKHTIKSNSILIIFSGPVTAREPQFETNHYHTLWILVFSLW